MNIETMNYIEKRMQEFGHENYHVQPLYVALQSGQEKVKVDAHNEFLFLVSDNFPEDIIIQSDTNVFISAGNNPFINLPQEFRGQVFIESNINEESILEFIRVIPE